MSEADVVTKRRGGRTARKELRAAPIPEAERPVKPGMEGGYYKPLTDREVERIHQAALSVLENIGFSEAIPSCIELFTDAGASMTDDGRLLISRAMVEDALAMAGRHFVLPGFDSKHDMEPWGTKVYFGTAGAAVHIVDLETR
ncbi:MAG: trimethylamine methyltransferase family protein, partial [Kiloniellales bacterium]